MASNTHFYFAWCGPNEGFSGGHMRDDELIFSFEMKHEEGQFPELELEILNPRVGLLAPGRPLWAWFSCSIDGNVYPLLYGRLIGIPDDLFAETIKIRLLARPLNYAAQRTGLANSLKVLPYYDPIFIDDSKLDDPDVALEGYARLWHVDRLSHAVSASDIITGEDGLVYFYSTDAFFDSVRMKVAGPPLLVCEADAEIGWTQCDHTGKYEMKTMPNLEPDTNAGGAGGNVGESSTGGGGGVKVKPSESQKEKPPKDETQATYSWSFKNITPGPHEDGDLMEESGSYTDPFYGGEITKHDESTVYADAETGQGEEYSIKESYKYTYEYQPPTPDSPDSGGGGGGGGGGEPPPTPKPAGNDAATAKQEVAVEVEQDRVEAIYVAMRANVQPVLVDVTENEKDLMESLSMNARDPVLIGAISASDGAYFATGRGQQSVEYMLMVCRAHLIAGSRIVEVEWECPFSRIIGLSCRLNAIIYDPRLPGGYAYGKIVGYSMTGDGDSGTFLGKITINCSVGLGAPLPASFDALREGVEERAATITERGTPSYAEENYVDLGYQYYVGQFLALPTNDVSYSPPAFQAVGLQLPITEDQILLRHEYHDGLADSGVYDALQSVSRQLADFNIAPIGQPITTPPVDAARYSSLSQQANAVIAQIYADNPSWVEMEFRPTKGLFVRAEYQAGVGSLEVPMHIDLSAPAEA